MDDNRAPERDEGDDDEIEIELRPPRDVADRLLVLSAICRRAFLENERGDLGEDPEAERFDLVAWLRDEGLDRLATPAERALLDTRVGTLDPKAAATASWQTEALASLGWALALVDAAPDYDAPADPAALLALLPAPWERSAPFRQRASLRDEATIATERERAELWHWRAGASEALASARGADRQDILVAIDEVAEASRRAELLPSLVGGDFPARGRPFRDLEPDALAEIGTVAEERLRALNWLCGFGSGWDDIPLDV